MHRMRSPNLLGYLNLRAKLVTTYPGSLEPARLHTQPGHRPLFLVE